MFENFFHKIDKELRPLNPDWFEELTTRASRDEGCPECAKAEGNETVQAAETSALASQLLSTPKIFKQRCFPQSSDSIPYEESQNEVANGDSSAFPWTESSPCLFGSAKDSPKCYRSSEKPRDYFGLLDTPKRSLTRSVKLISESLGAQINPDLSWTSSFNTPPSLTPTVILQTEDHVSSASGLKNKEAIFVRKLFPPTLKDSANATLKEDAIDRSEINQADDLGEKIVCSPDASLDTSSLWKQKVPSAIEDGDVRSTVQNVLDGAEDVLSIFFSNNTSVLRKIKAKERIRRRITDSSKDLTCDILTSETEEKLKADVEAKSPPKIEDSIQWTPLSLSESILIDDCSGPSLINNDNTVASSETCDGTAGSSQTVSQRVGLKSYLEGHQCQKSLLDKTPAFMLNRKPRRFVYQVPSSDMSRTVVENKASLPVCLDQTLKEGPTIKELSTGLNESRLPRENTITHQTEAQTVEELSTEPHYLDHGLDMTQLSKAFAEDFTQEIMAGVVPVEGDQKGQVQLKIKAEQKNKDSECSDVSNLAEISVNSPNKSTVMLRTFEISHDSGCPTTISDFDCTTVSCEDMEFFPTFKMANNKAICVSDEAIIKAKALLEEAAGDGLAETSKHYHKTETCSSNATRSPVGKSIFPNHASGVRVSDAPKPDSTKSFMNKILKCSSPHSNESDYKTCSKTNITDVGLQTESLLKEKLGRSSESSKLIHQKVDFEISACGTHKPTAVDPSRDDLEEKGALTESQKADVTELCSLLEEANSQHEFTQFKSTSLGSGNHNTEKEWDPDILNGIDFDDSFNSDVIKGKHPARTDATSGDPIDILDATKLCVMSKETRNGIVPSIAPEGYPVVDGLKNENTQPQCLGFKTAKGKVINISEKSLTKARHFFEEDNEEAKVDSGIIKTKHSEMEPLVNTSDLKSAESKTCIQQDVHFSCGDVNAAHNVINWQEAGNAGTEQNRLREKTDVVCVDSSHFGFSTARGAKLKVSEKALMQARELLNVDSIGESQTHQHAFHSSASTSRFKRTEDVCRGEASIKINQPDSGMVNKIPDGPDFPSFSSENVVQEQKSSKDICKTISSPETFMPQSELGYGFQTASGKGVSVSPSAFKKAKAIFKDCDSSLESANVDGQNVKLDGVKQTNALISNRKSELKKVFRDSDLSNDLDHQPLQKGLQSEFSQLIPLNSGFSTASGKEVSISAEALQRAKDVLSESVDGIPCANVFKKTNQVVDIQSSGKHKGFCTAGGKKLAVSAAGLKKAKDLFRECEGESLSTKDLQHQNCFSNASKKPGCNDISFIHEPEAGKSVGFSTAGGKKMAVSATALQRAKSFFKDCEEESLASGILIHQGCEVLTTASGKDVTVFAKNSFSSEPKKSSENNEGFSTASGKKVTISDTALQRATSIFDNCEEESLTSKSLKHQGFKGFTAAGSKDVAVLETTLSDVRATFGSSDEASFNHEPTNTKGFSTAGGKKVTISAIALQKAKNLFNDCEEENASEKVPPQTKSSHRSEDIVDGNLKFEQLNKKHHSFSTASAKGVFISKVALEEASKLFRESDTQVTDNQPQHKDRQPETTLHSKANQNEPAHLDLHSLDFNSCTDTQQMYFEQEAMACTEALLADDDLNQSVRLITSDSKINPPVLDLRTRESVDQNRKRKRLLDDSNVSDSGQPPLKRQLLSEFDRTLHAKASGLTPLKSCPNGTLRDRRVFKYHVHLKPNVTGPNCHLVDQKSNNLEEHRSAGSIQNRRNSGPKGGVFVPPFQKGINPGTSKCHDAAKVSSDFVKENEEKNDKSKELDQNMTNQQEGSKPKLIHSVESIILKTMDEKDMKAWQEALQLARDMQNMRLRKKKRQTILPVPGSLYLAKTSGVSRKALRDAVGCKCPGQYIQEEMYQHGVRHKVLEITSENAESFRFDCSDYFKCELLMESGALQLADGGWLVPDSKGTVGKEEFYSALCDTPGVDPKLISDAWLFNHYRWIVWKRASMERSFPNMMGGMCLTSEQVLLQLKFRYDVEVDHSQRSALRRIMERDDTPAKTLVLCVCGVAQTCQNPEKTLKDDKTLIAKMEPCVIWLTDGWYSIKGMLDPPLSAMLNKGRLKIGDKIVSSGAELIGSQEACPPLEAPESLMLKISANSTRRARWDTKLGYYLDPRPIRLRLSSLYSSGGVVSCVNIMVLRSYPTQWMEKKPNNVFIFRNDRAEDREARKHSNSKRKSMDLLISKIQTQFEKEMEGKKKNRGKRRTFSRHEIETLQDGEDLYEAMERDPAVETHLSDKQMEAVSKYRRCLEEKRQAELQERVQKAVMEAQEADGGCPNRDVTPVWKLSVTDANDPQSDCVYTLNIWRPTQDLHGLLKEGHRYRAYHLAASDGKKRSGIAHIQLTATKKTFFQDIEVSPEWLHQHFHARECAHFRELQNPHFSSPCGEVDIVGYIVSIEGKQGHCPVLHLVDENFDLVSVRTYNSLEQLAVEELVKPRALVALSNLQVRLLSGPVPNLYAGEQALFSINPKESHLQEAMARLKTFVQTCEQFFSIAEEKVKDVVSSGVLGSFQSPRTPGVQPVPKMNGTVTPQQKSSIFSPFTPLNMRTPVSANNSDTKDPKSLKRRRGLDYLSRIPSPPPLTPLKTRASLCVNSTFNPPRKSVTPKPPQNESSRTSRSPEGEEKWVHDEELAMIDTQALVDGLKEG